MPYMADPGRTCIKESQYMESFDNAAKVLTVMD